MTDDGARLGTPRAADAGSAGQQPVPDWRELLGLRRFGAAKSAYLAATLAAGGRVDDAVDDEVRSALTALADVEDLLRDRRYARAIARLARLEHKPPLAPWHDLQSDLEALAAAGKALDRREPEEVLTGLSGLGGSWFGAEVSMLLGTAHVYLGDEEAARPHFEDALAVDPKHYRALTNLGNLALERGEVDAAIELYEQALAVNEEFPNAHHNLGVAYRRKGQVGKSVKHLRRAQRLAQRQDAAEARESLSRVSGKRFGGAVKWLLWAAIGAAVWWVLRSQGAF